MTDKIAQCGHCKYQIRKVAGMWCHTDRAAYATPRHIAEPAPATIAEQLDAAQTGEEFGAVLNNLFKALETAKDNEND